MSVESGCASLPLQRRHGPYVVESLTQPLGEHAAALYFTLSTWNPYETMLMRAELSWQ